VIAWNADPLDDVRSDYIFMEVAKGMALADIWQTLPENAQHGVIQQVVEMQKSLLSAQFPANGSIYYATDLRQDRSHRIDACSSRAFAVGLWTSEELWEDGRGDLAVVSKGPCQFDQATGTALKSF
jgi:hypothetical protein